MLWLLVRTNQRARINLLETCWFGGVVGLCGDFSAICSNCATLSTMPPLILLPLEALEELLLCPPLKVSPSSTEEKSMNGVKMASLEKRLKSLPPWKALGLTFIVLIGPEYVYWFCSPRYIPVSKDCLCGVTAGDCK